MALDRVELLKDGAAATYGSDAISGVVNFITRSDFEGLEVSGSFKEISGSDGDADFGLLWGTDSGATNIVTSFGYVRRNELAAKDRNWAIQPYNYNGNGKGYTGIPNPGSFFPTSGTAITGGAIRDPRCADFSGAASVDNPDAPRANCTYNYVYFDNLIEDETRHNFFTEITHEFTSGAELSAELLYASSEVPHWKSSPSYPPQTLVDLRPDTGRFVPSYHPGLVAMADLYSEFAPYASSTCSVSGASDTSCDALLFFGRPFGASGPAEEGSRNYDTTRIALGLEGTLDSGLDYNLSALSTQAHGENRTNDTIAENWSLALRGFGGPDCIGNTPGANGCQFYNPFSNAIESPLQKGTEGFVNPDYDPALANSPELREWMTEAVGSKTDSTLSLVDAVVSGEANVRGTDIGWAAGLQSRREEYVVKPFEGSNLDINPCQTEAENEAWRAAGSDSATFCNAGTPGDVSDDYEGSGRFIFLAGATPFDDAQTINAAFVELALPLADNLETQISARYEDYGGDTGSSFDPKIAVRLEASDAWTLRGSASTTFRGPTLNQLGGRSTTLSFVGPTGTFKAVDTFGTEDLDPESATTANLGAIFTRDDFAMGKGSLTVSVDYWRFDFEDPIIKEDFNSLIALAFPGGTLDPSSPYASRFNLAGDGTSSSDIQRIKVNMINGPDIDTDGIDVAVMYETDAGPGTLTYTGQLTQTLSYDVGASELGSGFDALGTLNDNVAYLRPVVELKGKLGVKYERGDNTYNLVANYTGDYEDNPPNASAPNSGFGPRDIDDHITFDMHYNTSINNGNSAVWLSIYNLTDEDPPYARLDLNYDPYTHNPFGRMIKLGLRHSF